MIPLVFDPAEPPSPRLVHFTGRARGTAPLPDAVAHLNGEQRLASILSTGALRAFPVRGTGTRAVIGMSDISPADLQAAFRIGLNARGPFEPWALVMDRDGMWSSGARPVMYADYVALPKLQEVLEEHTLGGGALVQRIDLNMFRADWTHEREWRWVATPSRDSIPVWPQLDAVIVGAAGWQPPLLDEHPDAKRVQRWWWTGADLVDDGRIAEPSHYAKRPGR